MKKRLKTVVCGSTFGQFYLEALSKNPEQFELCGLVANGSERSKLCAENYHVKLYHTVDELPDDIDLACVVLRSNVLGGRGTDMTMDLMKKKIHVIQEHPIHPKDLEVCYKGAKENHVLFQTGNLYANLPEVKKFAACAQYLNKIQKPAYIDVKMAAQVSYPAIEILMQALVSIRKWKLHYEIKDNGPFTILNGTIDDIPITFEIHNEVYPKDPDNHMYLLHKINIVYESGRLNLEDTFGPVIWNPRMHVSTDLYKRGKIKGDFPYYMEEKSATILGKKESCSFRNLMEDVWTDAVLEDLCGIRQMILNGKFHTQKAQREILATKTWNSITRDMGYAKMIGHVEHNVVLTSDLEAVVQAIH